MSDNNSFTATGSPDDVGTDKRRTVVALGALAVVSLGAGAFFFLLGGSGSEEEPAAAPPATSAPATPAAPVAVPVNATLPTPTDLTIGRNPFKVPGIYIAPVVQAPAAGTVTPPTGSTGTGTVTPPSTGPVTPPPTGTVTPVPATPVPVTGTPGTGEPTPVRHKLVLLRVFGEGADQSASFSIQGTEQTAKVGSIFGPNAEILLIELTEAPLGVWTATLQVGDGDPFDVVMGEPAYVR